MHIFSTMQGSCILFLSQFRNSIMDVQLSCMHMEVILSSFHSLLRASFLISSSCPLLQVDCWTTVLARRCRMLKTNSRETERSNAFKLKVKITKGKTENLIINSFRMSVIASFDSSYVRIFGIHIVPLKNIKIRSKLI